MKTANSSRDREPAPAMPTVPLSRRKLVGLGAACALGMAFSTSAFGQSAKDYNPGEKKNIETVRGFERDLVNAHDPAECNRYFAPKVKVYLGAMGVVEGRDACIAAFTAMFRGIPDLHGTEQEILASGDTVVVRLVMEGTQTGELWGVPATGRKLRWEANNIFKVADGQIVEERGAEDWMSVFVQLGLFKPPVAK